MKETSGSLTNTTVAVAEDLNRQGLVICNTSDTVMTYRPLGTATAAIGIPIPAGTAISIDPTLGRGIAKGAGTVFCAGTSKTYYILEW